MAVKNEELSNGARNQALFRDVNERIKDLTESQRGQQSQPVDFLCECADTDCTETIALTREEYEAARGVSTHFPVKPGHVYPELEHVVQETDRYTVVEKFGEAGTVAAERDPRRRESAEQPAWLN